MINHHSDRYLEVIAHDPVTLENDLNAAEAIARELAMQERLHGILVTRHHHTTYTVALSNEVPYGQTHEHHKEPKMT
jgi:hypothetical protein